MGMMTPEDIKRLRLTLRMTAREFGELVGVSEDSVYFWEAGTRHPNYRNLVRLNEIVSDLDKRRGLEPTG